MRINIKAIIPIIVFILAIVLIKYSGLVDKDWNERCCHFFDSRINGIVYDYSSGTSGTHLRLVDEKILYTFSEKITPSTLRYIDIVAKGDSISKSEFGDEMTIFKKKTNEIFKISLNNCCKK